MRTLSYRVDVLRDNIPVTSLRFASPPSISCDYDSEIHLTMRGEFVRNPEVNFIRSELRPVMILDGTEYPLGIYRVGTHTTRETIGGAVYDTLECYDRGIILQWTKTESLEFFERREYYTEVISALLARAGIMHAIVTPNDAKLQTDREDWDVGTSFLTIINTLLSEINYAPLWFDLNGIAHCEPYTEPSPSNIAHTFGAGGISLLRPEYTSEIDLFSVPNVFIGIVENPELPTNLYAKSVNDTPSSSLSTMSRGIRIPQVYKLDNIASAEELQKYVDRLRNESMRQSEYITIQTAAMPGHNIGDTIAITHPELSGIFREISWSLQLQAGALMSHKLQRQVII